MVHCVWGLCANDDKYNKADCKRPRTEYLDTFWVKWPKDPAALLRWIKDCGTENLQQPSDITRSKRICSLHFVGGKGPTPEYPDPVPCVQSDTEIAHWMTNNKKRKGRTLPVANQGGEKSHSCLKAVKLTESDAVSLVDNGDREMSATTSPDSATKDASTQTFISASDISWVSDEDLKSQKVLRRTMTVQDITADDSSSKFYTGLTLVKLWFLFSRMQAKASRMSYGKVDRNNNDNYSSAGPRRILTLWQEFLLCLVRLRRGLDIDQLADMFTVSPSTVSRTFNTWVNLLARELPNYLLRWPSREQIDANRPSAFKKFSRTRAIIDCTEFFIQRPSMPSSQRRTWSSYKQHNTFKALVAITPQGYISFISQLWSGNVSDRHLTLNCGFTDLIEPQDDVMADRGFVIRDALALKGATLNIPPFTKNGRLSSQAVTKTRRIARARIHVERAIGRLKCFKILSGIIPLKMKKKMDEIFVACACLCNLDKPLVK